MALFPGDGVNMPAIEGNIQRGLKTVYSYAKLPSWSLWSFGTAMLFLS
jgi:hypothetical protein